MKREREHGALPRPLNGFGDERAALAFAREHKLRVIEHIVHASGVRLNVVDGKGHPYTLRVRRAAA